MKTFKLLSLALLITTVPIAHGISDECFVATPSGEEMNLSSALDDILDKLYEDVLNIKVKHDGEGKLSVLYNTAGEPEALRFKYGKQNETLTFDEIANGRTISYENEKLKGKALIVEKGSPFKSGAEYNFSFKVRTAINPDQYETYPVTLAAKSSVAAVKYSNANVSEVIISPGVKKLKWDGTFPKVVFK